MYNRDTQDKAEVKFRRDLTPEEKTSACQIMGIMEVGPFNYQNIIDIPKAQKLHAQGYLSQLPRRVMVMR